MKLSGFKPRQTPLRATAPPKASVPLLKLRKCPVKKGGCGASFRPLRPGQLACMGEGCAVAVGAWLTASKAKAAHKEDVKQTRAAREAMKTIPQLKKEAQREFNRYIRARDRASGVHCISSGRPLEWDVPGGLVDAGHYRSTGAADHLRFNEDNCHAQSVRDNRDLGGNAVAYRAGLIARIGLERVEALEANNTPVKWTREGLANIRDSYRRRANALEKARR